MDPMLLELLGQLGSRSSDDPIIKGEFFSPKAYEGVCSNLSGFVSQALTLSGKSRQYISEFVDAAPDFPSGGPDVISRVVWLKLYVTYAKKLVEIMERSIAEFKT